MKFPWSKSPEILELQKENEEMKRAIEANQPVVDEAVRRTDNHFIQAEEMTRDIARRIPAETALLRDLEEGWGLRHG